MTNSLPEGEIRFALYLDDKKYALQLEGLRSTQEEADYVIALFKSALYGHWGLVDTLKKHGFTYRGPVIQPPPATPTPRPWGEHPRNPVVMSGSVLGGGHDFVAINSSEEKIGWD